MKVERSGRSYFLNNSNHQKIEMNQKLKCLLALAACLLPMAAPANDIEPGKEFYTAIKATKPIVIDGNLSEWTGANVIADPRFYTPKGSGSVVPPSGTVFALFGQSWVLSCSGGWKIGGIKQIWPQLGEALTNHAAVRRGLSASDLYVIEPRSYHADYERLVNHYDRLRVERGCSTNLDLQRIAIPASGGADWILKGRNVERIVVERMEDANAFMRHGALPVVHLAELADH